MYTMGGRGSVFAAQPEGASFDLKDVGDMPVMRTGNAWCYQIIPRTDFTFNVNLSTTQEIIIAKYVNTLGFVSGGLLVRVHARPSWPAGPELRVVAQPTRYSEDEPNIQFFTTTGETVLTNVVTSGSAVPGLFNMALVTPIPPQLRVLLRLVQGGGDSTNSCAISVDLYGRSA
jgi:hypothetical protein